MADALSKVKNPDGSVTNLVFDVHKYLGAPLDCVPKLAEVVLTNSQIPTTQAHTQVNHFDCNPAYDTHRGPECVTNNIDAAFTPLAAYLRKNKRMAFLTET